MRVDPQQLEKAIFLGMGIERFTQDSPILPDVWAEYGQKPGERVDLLLNPYNDESPGRLCEVLLKRLKTREDDSNRYRILPDLVVRKEHVIRRDAAINQSTVVLRLYFDELVCVMLPMTCWWNQYVWRDDEKDEERKIKHFLKDKQTQEKMIEFMRKYPLERDESSAAQPDDQKKHKAPEFSSEILWLVRLVGAIALAAKGGPADAQHNGADTYRIDGHEKEVVEAGIELLNGFQTVMRGDLGAVEEPTGPRPSQDKALDWAGRSFIWSASLNRQAKTAMNVSTTTVKADAARLLFDISCKHLTWAIIDSGVDASHPALQRRPPPTPWKASSKSKATAADAAEESPAGAPANAEEEPQRPPWTETTRVVATYDFTIIRRLLNREEDLAWTAQLPQKLAEYFGENEPKMKEFRTRLKHGRSIDWDFLLPYLAIPYVKDPRGRGARARPRGGQCRGGGNSQRR